MENKKKIVLLEQLLAKELKETKLNTKRINNIKPIISFIIFLKITFFIKLFPFLFIILSLLKQNKKRSKISIPY